MSEPNSNPSRCYAKRAEQEGPSLVVNGTVVFQAHHVGWIVSGFFAIVATITSFWLINKHLQWYTKKREQRYIVRLLFMVPIYANISLASYLFWNHSTPLLLLRDCYEAIVLTGFFYLLLTYVSPHPNEQRLVFLKHGLSKQADAAAIRRGDKPSKWMFPLGFIKTKPADGLYFLQMMKWGVLQYCVIRPLSTLASVTLDYMGLYCESSWSPAWGHIYLVLIISGSVSIAMYCLIQLYMPISKQLAPHKPLLKLFSVKAVVFLTFWQASALSLLSMLGVVKDSKYMTADEINIGFGALLETFEMMIFAFVHIKAFSYKPYRPAPSDDGPPQRTPRLKSLANAMDFRETFREIWYGWLYLWDRFRGREARQDTLVRRTAHLESALGKSRTSHLVPGSGVPPTSEKDIDDLPVDRAERQWLGINDSHDYTLRQIDREKSDGLELQIERELERRGIGSHVFPAGRLQPLPDDYQDHTRSHSKQRSWWRGLYDRISQSTHEREVSASKKAYPSQPQLPDSQSLLHPSDYDLDDPPPEGIISTYKSKASSKPKFTHRASHLRAAPTTGLDDAYSAVPNDPRYLSAESLQPSATGSVFGRIFPPRTNTDTSLEYLTSAAHSKTSHQTEPGAAIGRGLAPMTPTIVPRPARHSIGVVGRPETTYTSSPIHDGVVPNIMYHPPSPNLPQSPSRTRRAEGRAGHPNETTHFQYLPGPHSSSPPRHTNHSPYPAPRYPQGLRRMSDPARPAGSHHSSSRQRRDRMDSGSPKSNFSNRPPERSRHRSRRHETQNPTHPDLNNAHPSRSGVTVPSSLAVQIQSHPEVPLVHPGRDTERPSPQELRHDLSRYPRPSPPVSPTSNSPPQLPRGAQPSRLHTHYTGDRPWS